MEVQDTSLVPEPGLGSDLVNPSALGDALQRLPSDGKPTPKPHLIPHPLLKFQMIFV